MTVAAGVSVVVSAAERAAAWWVAAQPGDPDPASGRPPEWGKAAPAGLLIWLFLGAALFFLIKSMNRHIKRVPKSFEADAVGGSVQDEPDGDAVAPVSDALLREAAERGTTLSSAGGDPVTGKPE